MIYKIHLIDPQQIKRFELESDKSIDYIYKNDKGIYFLWENEDIVYVGKSNELLARLDNHNVVKEHSISHISILPILNNFEMDIAEIFYIHKLKPKYNKQYKYLDEEEITEIYI